MKQPLIPPPPNPPSQKFTIGNLATMSSYHMIILIGFLLAVRQPEFFKYEMLLYSMIASFEAFFGLAFLNFMRDSIEYAAFEFTGLLISNGIIANITIYMINHHLCLGTAIWWLFCLGIVARNLTSKVKVPPPQNTTVTVTVSPIED